MKVTVGISGTGGGFKKFCRGETDISNASRPILKSEMADCKQAGVTYLELPVAYDALTVVINPKNTWVKSMTVAELKKMWEPAAQGKITKWNQVNPAWPDQPIKLFGAGADSGTFDYFTEAINGKSKASRGDFTASEDDNVLVTGVSRDVNATRLFRLRLLRSEPRQAEGGADRRQGRKAGGGALVANRGERHLPAVVAPDLHLRQREVGGETRGEGIHRVLQQERAASW